VGYTQKQRHKAHRHACEAIFRSVRQKSHEKALLPTVPKPHHIVNWKKSAEVGTSESLTPKAISYQLTYR